MERLLVDSFFVALVTSIVWVIYVYRERLNRRLSQYSTPAVQRNTEIEPLHSILSEQEPEFAEIVGQFIARLPNLINMIDVSYQAQDWQKLREVVHNLKGMGGGFGFPQLTQYAAEIEKWLDQGEYTHIAPAIERLQGLNLQIQAGMPRDKAP